MVGVAHDRQSAHALRVSGADLLKLLRWRVLRRDVLERENIVDRPPVGMLHDGVMVVVLGLLLGGPAGDDAHRIDAELLALLLRLLLGRRNLLRGLIERGAGCLQEECVAVADREGLADRRSAGVHDHRPRSAIGLGLAADALHVQVLAFEVEVLLVRPDHLDDVDPLLRVFVARFMLALLDAEHREFALVPPDHDVEPEAAFADVVGGHHFLGGNDRVEKRRMHGAEDRHALGESEQARRPGDGLERRALVVGIAAIALPAPDREQEIDADVVGHPGELEIVRPAPRPALRNQGDRASRRAVRPEQADLELVRIVHRHAIMAGRSGSEHGASSSLDVVDGKSS